jgi:hypothetical protein
MKDTAFKNTVFERTYGNDTIGIRSYYLIISVIVLWGLILTAIIASMSTGLNLNGWQFLYIGFALPIAGCFTISLSDNLFLKFIGYHMIVVPFGIIIEPLINHYMHSSNPNVVSNSIFITIAITVLMCGAGVCFPKFFEKIKNVLFIGLIALLFVLVGCIIFQVHNLGIISYFAALLFSLFIGYDMHRAYSVTKTIRNAIDIAVGLYLDILNLFLYILKIVK